jgi:hypothetical protein
VFFADLAAAAAAAEGPAITAAVAAVAVDTAATAQNGHVVSRVNASDNAAADIVLIAGVSSGRTAASTTGPYSIFRWW